MCCRARRLRRLIKTCNSVLNTLPKIKNFLFNKADNFPIDILYVGGDPRIVFMDEKGEEIEEIDISKMDEIKIENLIESKGFLRYDKTNLKLKDE